MYFILYFIFAAFTSLARAFFLLGGDGPLLFCVKVCPLYCSPRRRDEDVSSLIYDDEPAFLPYDFEDSWKHEVSEIPYHFDPYFFCKPPKPTTTTTTPAPTTTTAEPSYICMVCMKKCSKAT